MGLKILAMASQPDKKKNDSDPKVLIADSLEKLQGEVKRNSTGREKKLPEKQQVVKKKDASDFSDEIKKLQRLWKTRPDETIKLADNLLATGLLSDKEKAEVWYRKGRSHRIKGEPLSAIEAHRKAAELAPDSPSYLNGYAWILSTVKPTRFRKPDLALKTARRAVELSHHRSANYLDTLARTLFVMGYREEAFITQKDAVNLAPGRRSFRRRLRKYENSLMAAD
jgi:tetratricopeptide (TPR) repeat protein